MVEAAPDAHLTEFVAGQSLLSVVRTGRDADATRIIGSVLNQLHSASIPEASPGLIPLPTRFGSLHEAAGLLRDGARISLRVEDPTGASDSVTIYAEALAELYETRQDNTMLTHRAYDDFGGVPGSIAKRAETAYDELTKYVSDNFPISCRSSD